VSSLKEDLDLILEPGMASDPLDHARQVAAITAILHCAFDAEGMTATLIGGSAIEVYAPGIFASGDIDLIVEDAKGAGIRDRINSVLVGLGFEKAGRHWKKGPLFVEVPSHSLDDPSQTVHVGPFVFRVIAKESLLADRVVGFRQWGHTSYAQQAIDMIAAFGDELDHERLGAQLRREGSEDAYQELKRISASQDPVTEEGLKALLKRLRG
jgi:hypothetical protein